MAYDVYARQSEEGSSDTAAQEAAARALADRLGLEVSEVVEDTASGVLAADDRELGKLIARVERGDSDGIIVWDERRFARDPITGGVALNRIVAAGGRLLSTTTGFDSANLTPETRLVFDLMMSVGRADRDRNRLRRQHGKAKAARAGVWCGGAPPVGYDIVDGKLVPNSDADKVREAFRLRAEGKSYGTVARLVGPVRSSDMGGHTGGGHGIRREERTLSRGGIRHLLSNVAYLGIQRIPRPGEGDPLEVENSHPPVVSRQEWEAANAVERGQPPVRTGLTKMAVLRGIASCGVCGKRMHVTGYGPRRDKATYGCPGGCTSLAARTLEGSVIELLHEAIAERNPHVAAVIEGDTRYADALTAVEQAQHDLAEYRDDVEVQRTLGMKAFADGLRVRKAAVEAARRALRDTPRPEAVKVEAATIEEADRESRKDFYRRVIAEVRVNPRTSKNPRMQLRWTGSEELLEVPEFKGVTSPVPMLPTGEEEGS